MESKGRQSGKGKGEGVRVKEGGAGREWQAFLNPNLNVFNLLPSLHRPLSQATFQALCYGLVVGLLFPYCGRVYSHSTMGFTVL